MLNSYLFSLYMLECNISEVEPIRLAIPVCLLARYTRSCYRDAFRDFQSGFSTLHHFRPDTHHIIRHECYRD